MVDPGWRLAADRALCDAAARVRLIGAATPTNWAVELARLTATWTQSAPARPRFVYPPAPDHAPLRRALDRIADALSAEGGLGELYGARAAELSDEAELCEAVGTKVFSALAARRFAPRDDHDLAADALADEWLGPEPPGARIELDACRTDDEGDPGSLLSRMRQTVSTRGLAVRVVVARELASLAATGDGVVQIVRGRSVSRRAVERTVLHEIEGHVVPRLAAERAGLGIFAFGTARGSDDQEGRALALERRAGFLEPARRRELALRHVAARSAHEGRSFVDTVHTLARLDANDRPDRTTEHVRVAARAHRAGGLGRERVYLPGLLRVEAAVAADPGIEAVLSLGRVAVDAAGALLPFVP